MSEHNGVAVKENNHKTPQDTRIDSRSDNTEIV
jgi:hypothetical protein